MNCVFPSTLAGDHDGTHQSSSQILLNVHQQLRNHLQEKVSDTHESWMPRLSPSPMLVPLKEYDDMLELQKALHTGITAILKLWWRRHPLVCSTISIPQKLEQVLRSQLFFDDRMATHIGCYRPDIIFDEYATMKVCEINARFTVNGYFLSVFLAEASHQGIFQPLLSSESKLQMSPIPSTLAFPRSLAQKIRTAVSVGDNSKDVVVYCIRGREPGHDLDWLAVNLKDFDITVKYVSKSQLTAEEDNKLMIDKETEVRFCVLELHQDELLDLSNEVLNALMKLSVEGCCLNPLWTICLVHDKRLLSLLTSLRSLLNEDIHVEEIVLMTLKKHVIPTMVCGLDEMKSLLSYQSLNDGSLGCAMNQLLGSSLVVKPALLGKGEGIVLQKNFISNQAFYEAIEKEYASIEHLLYHPEQQQHQREMSDTDTSSGCPSDNSSVNGGTLKTKQLIVQPFLENQKHFLIADEPCDATVHGVTTTTAPTQNWHCVGTLLCMDDRFFGPGIFRFSSQDLIALTRGGIAVTPVHMWSNIPSSCVHRVESFPSIIHSRDGNVDKNREIADSLRSCLVEEGIAILSCDSSSVHMSNVSLDQTLSSFLVEAWQATPKEPAVGKGVIWSICPQNQGVARSHQSEEFDTHTDASYEIDPPRYFALAVKTCDMRGGGRNGFARIADVVQQLSDEEFDILRTTMVRWNVPIEFRKSSLPPHEQEEFIMAPVLMSRERARVRPDIMNLDHLLKTEDEKDKTRYYQFQRAFHRFYQLLQEGCEKSRCLLPEGTVLLMDNHRFVHCRSAIKDMSRHLIRIRFDLQESPEVESVCRLVEQSTSSSVATASVYRLKDCSIMKKSDLLANIQQKFGNQSSQQGRQDEERRWFHGKEGVYWSPSGGSTSSATLSTEQCAIPSLLSENEQMRHRLRDQLRQFGAFSKQSVVLNLMACGNLYRSLEIFHEIVVSIGGTALPLGADASEESIFQFIRHFKVNTICAWPSKLMKLITYAKEHDRKHHYHQQDSDKGNLLNLLQGIQTIVHGGELLNQAKRDLLLSVCGKSRRLFGVFGSAEVGIFATTNGNPHEDDLYYIVPDTVHIELLQDEDGESIRCGDEDQSIEGTIVATSLIRKGIQPIVRFWMDDRAYWYPHGRERYGHEQVIRLTGRSGVSIAFPLGPTFLRWSDIQSEVISRFEESFGSSLILGQVWIDCGTVEGKDCLSVRLFIDLSSEDETKCQSCDSMNTLVKEGLTKLRELVKDVPNLETISIQRISSVQDLAFNKRSNKQLYFVDNRNSQHGDHCEALNHWFENL